MSSVFCHFMIFSTSLACGSLVFLPKIIRMDGLFRSDKLNFKVPGIPKGMMEKALWYVTKQSTHILATRDRAGQPMFYILSKSNTMGADKILLKHIECYNKAWDGEKDKCVSARISAYPCVSTSTHAYPRAPRRIPEYPRVSARTHVYPCFTDD